MNITVRQVDAFRAVIGTRSVTNAARILGVSQPAISRLISDLEKVVGYKLFDRSGRSLEPTIEARLLAEEVARNFSGLERIRESARSIGEFCHARLRIVSTPTAANAIVSGVLTEFVKRFPNAKVTLEIQPDDHAVDWMVSQEFDFGVASPDLNNQSLERLPLLCRNAICVVPIGHPLADSEIANAPDFEGQSFVSYLPDSFFKFKVDEVFAQLRVSRRMLYEARTTEAVCRLVAAGLGVAVVGFLEMDQLQFHNVKALPFLPEIPFQSDLIWSRRRPLTAAAREFLEMARELVKSG